MALIVDGVVGVWMLHPLPLPLPSPPPTPLHATTAVAIVSSPPLLNAIYSAAAARGSATGSLQHWNPTPSKRESDDVEVRGRAPPVDIIQLK